MDKVIKITSQQGFSDSWTVASAPTTLNLVDFTIPRGYNINMSKSYISFSSQFTSSTAAPVNVAWYLDTTNNEKFNVPTSALIRNAHINNDRGQVEAIRRNDTLSCALWSLTQTAESQKGDMNSFAIYENGRGVNNHSSYNLDSITNNSENDGTTTASGLSNVSRMLNRDIKVPLKDFLGVGNTEKYSTDIMGETRIHCETNFKNLKSVILGGDEDSSLMFDETNNYGDMAPMVSQIADNTSFIMESAGGYGDWQYTYPFFVGQAVQVAYTADQGIGAITVDTTIVSINFQSDNTATPPTGQSKVFAVLADSILDNTTGAIVNITAIKMTAKINATITNTINRAELVLYTIPDDGNMPESLTYPCYTTEEDNGNGLNSFAKSYVCEPEADAVIICLPKTSDILPNLPFESYRYSVNQVEQTGNRSIPVCTNLVHGSSLQYERLQRCLEEQIGVGWRNGHLRFYKQLQDQDASYPDPISVIAETLEQTPETKMLNLEIECAAGLQQIVIYKHMTKTI